MGVPLAGDFDVAVTKPVDSRMVWTGTSNNLNNILNKYEGLISYVTGDKNLYFYKGISSNWAKILLSGDAVSPLVDINNITQNFTFNTSLNAELLTINASSNITGTVPIGLPNGYNVSFVQMGNGQLFITGSGGAIVQQRLNLFRTAGQYGIASLLHHNGDKFILYGDLI